MKQTTMNPAHATNTAKTCLSDLTMNERRILLYVQAAFMEACQLSGKTGAETIELWRTSKAAERYNEAIRKA